jgi:hypothetical protein
MTELRGSCVRSFYGGRVHSCQAVAQRESKSGTCASGLGEVVRSVVLLTVGALASRWRLTLGIYRR